LSSAIYLASVFGEVGGWERRWAERRRKEVS
jgi:hypothetical protein